MTVDVEYNFEPAVVRGHLDWPKPRSRIADDEVMLVGWALGTERPVAGMQVVADGSVVRRFESNQSRPDVARAFPDQGRAESSGFSALIRLATADSSELLVQAVLDDGRVAPLSRLHVRRSAVLDAGALPPVLDGEYDLTMAEAMERYHSSPAVRWSKMTHDAPPPGSAWQRICDNEFFEPLIRPEFTIDRGDRVFTIGSCFAREVEGALASLGMNVASRTSAFDRYPMIDIGEPLSFTNKYNTEAIRSELRWALEPGQEFPRGGLVRLLDGNYQDPFGGPDLKFAPEDVTLERRRLLTELTRQVADCRVVVITLGLIETFIDLKTGLYTNVKPRAEADRFRFRVLTYEQVMEGLDDIHRLLSAHGHPDMQIFVTVSPVPVWATFTGQDVVLANTLSKSVLRAAAGSWTRQHRNVHYFPSYEIVMNSDKAIAWERDGRHVRAPFVRKIMDLFIRTHVSQDTGV